RTPPPVSSPLSLHDALPISPLRWPPSRRPPYPPPYRPPPPLPGGRCSRGRASFTVIGRPSMVWPLSFEIAFCASSSEPMVTKARSEEHTSELQSRFDLVCRL